MDTSTQPTRPHHEQPAPSDQLLDRFYLVWIVIAYMTLALGIYWTYADQPAQLRGWSGVGFVGLIMAFVAAYHGIYLSWSSNDNVWPMPLRQALIYFSIQTLLLVLLLHYSNGFIGVGYVLIGHAMGALSPRQWPIYIIVVFAILAAPMGLYDQIQRGNWLAFASFAFSGAIFAVIGLLIYLLSAQRTRLTNLIAELRQARDDLEAYALQAEELAALRERNRLAREMHDSLGHALVVVNVKLEAAQRLYHKELVRGDAELEATRQLVRETMADLRRSLENLRAPVPDHYDLPTVFQRLSDEIRDRSGLTVICSTAPNLPDLPGETTEALWRIAREALTNVERHAAAACATLTLECSNGACVLRVTDDGSGITAMDLKRPGHYGVVGMRERIEAVGGTFQITTHTGGGTVVEACVPIEHGCEG